MDINSCNVHYFEWTLTDIDICQSWDQYVSLAKAFYCSLWLLTILNSLVSSAQSKSIVKFKDRTGSSRPYWSLRYPNSFRMSQHNHLHIHWTHLPSQPSETLHCRYGTHCHIILLTDCTHWTVSTLFQHTLTLYNSSVVHQTFNWSQDLPAPAIRQLSADRLSNNTNNQHYGWTARWTFICIRWPFKLELTSCSS